MTTKHKKAVDDLCGEVCLFFKPLQRPDFTFGDFLPWSVYTPENDGELGFYEWLQREHTCVKEAYIGEILYCGLGDK